METLKEPLKQLRLPALAAALELRNQYALDHQVSYLEFLELLLEDEWAARQGQAYHKRLVASRLSSQKLLSTYDFTYQPQLDKRLVYDLASCRFIEEHRNIVLLGNPGVGKTHLATALGLEAVKKGYKVLFTHANEVIEKLHTSKADGSYRSALNKILAPDLLIIDELGFKKVPLSGLDDFFQIIRQRYEKASIIITSNRNFEDWGQILGDAVMASAIIDRIIHHATVIKITGSSYRLKNYLSPDGLTQKTQNQREKQRMDSAKEQ
jgi:DNA replication protein DnaC